MFKNHISTTDTLSEYIITPLINSNKSNLTVVTTTISTIVRTHTTTTTSQKIDMVEQGKTIDLNLTSKLPTTQNTNISQQPKEAFVTFCNNQPSYLTLLNVLLDSVHSFSTRPIIVFGIDVDPDVDDKKYPRVIKRRISQSDCGPSVYFCKIHAIVSSNVEYGVLMETDDVVNYNIDILFDVLHLWPYPFPLSPRHPDDPQNYHDFMRQHNVSTRTTPYIHAHMIWNYLSIPFLTNLRTLLQQGNFQGANFDETAVNVMLWKAKANHTLCKYDPFFTYSEAYLKWPTITNCSNYCYTAFITLHGCKEHNISADLLTKLKANAGKPAMQTFGMGGMKHINDTSVTCCYPDSKPSPIHPLLCEHKQVE
ncbi:unnamed protein product [Rotaria sp. Silwood1]|nr:unnamed protein product [Rotaria sp. Silwood1]CAF3513955.1 unnamed protein product [Rotaria sp. Silwood1]CAF4559879.1 unnamed protein product [Rotaria sp. Silwood1]